MRLFILICIAGLAAVNSNAHAQEIYTLSSRVESLLGSLEKGKPDLKIWQMSFLTGQSMGSSDYDLWVEIASIPEPREPDLCLVRTVTYRQTTPDSPWAKFDSNVRLRWDAPTKGMFCNSSASLNDFFLVRNLPRENFVTDLALLLATVELDYSVLHEETNSEYRLMRSQQEISFDTETRTYEVLLRSPGCGIKKKYRIENHVKVKSIGPKSFPACH